MNIHLGFWIVRTAIALAFIFLFAHFFPKVERTDNANAKFLMFIIVFVVMFWGAYSLVTLVR